MIFLSIAGSEIYAVSNIRKIPRYDSKEGFFYKLICFANSFLQSII
ncbi:hypothetical protein EV145_103483 [Flavobacterium sp. 245]|nr:hypothetical protein EV145_103483 [Flavobacterium sp. 245]